MRAPKTIGKIGWAGTKGSTTGPVKDTKNPYKFIPKTNYSKEDINCLFQTVTSNTISSLDKLDILEKAVAPCPKINIQIKDQQEAWRLYAELLYVIEICNHFVHMFESVYIIFL